MHFIDFHQSFEISENICCAAVQHFCFGNQVTPGSP